MKGKFYFPDLMEFVSIAIKKGIKPTNALKELKNKMMIAILSRRSPARND
jgi:hypothetical protein